MNDKQIEMETLGALDEGWWESVLQEELLQPKSATPLAGRRGGASPTNTDDAWQEARRLHEAEEIVELEVVGHNRGGLIVGLQSLRCFVPVSHLLNFPPHLSEADRTAALLQRVGSRLRLKVIEYDLTKGRVVFSERAAQANPGSRKQLLATVQPNDELSGVVTNVCDFGVFVDLGGVEGLIHVSEVSWRRVSHPRDVVHCNQRIQVLVLSVDARQGRVALSLKRLHPDPWGSVAQRYALGQIVEGTVTSVVDFGAFICVEEGLEGLVHVSELSDENFLHPRSVLREGERVKARVVNIDGPGRRMGLSLRRADNVE